MIHLLMISASVYESFILMSNKNPYHIGTQGIGKRIPGVTDPVIQLHGLAGVRVGLYQMPSLSYCRNHETIDQKIFVKCLSVLLFSRGIHDNLKE